MKKAYLILLAGFFVFNIQAQNQEHKEFFDNGILEVEGFKDEKGANTGTWKYYHGTGQLAKIGNYLEVNHFKSNDNLSVEQAIQPLATRKKNRLWRQDKYYKRLAYLSIFIFIVLL